MIKIKKLFTYLIVISFSLMSCESDFKLTGEWKETTIVYGLLNQTDSIHYLKISKAFLGEGNILKYAQIEDSSAYFGNLTVKIDEIDANKNILRTFEFDTTSIYNKDSGTFFSPHQIVYKSEFKLPANSQYTYNLTVKNRLSGNIVTSSTKLVNDFNINEPSASVKTLDFANTFPGKIRLNSNNIRLFDMSFRFYYYEISKTNDTLLRSINWAIGTIKVKELSQFGDNSETTYTKEAFFSACKNDIPYKDEAKEKQVSYRYTSKVELIIIGADDELCTYVEVNAPSTGIVIEKPDYTNINNGFGIFASRYYKISAKLLNSMTISKLKEETNLKFIK